MPCLQTEVTDKAIAENTENDPTIPLIIRDEPKLNESGHESMNFSYIGLMSNTESLSERASIFFK